MSSFTQQMRTVIGSPATSGVNTSTETEDSGSWQFWGRGVRVTGMDAVGPRQGGLTQLGIGGRESGEVARGGSGQWLKAWLTENLVLLEGEPYGLAVENTKGSGETEEVCRSWGQKGLVNQGQEC